MLIVKIFGGLGNQMFQYAFAKYMEKCGNSVYLDCSDFKTHRHHQGYELDKIFNINIKEADPDICKKLSINQNRIILRILKKLFGYQIIKKSEVIEKQTITYVYPEIINEDSYFSGYWQNINYLLEIREEIYNDFKFKETLSKKEVQFFNNYKEFNLVSIHVRRGDYLNNNTLNNICNLDYYYSAIRKINNIVDKCMFIIFSDDIEWCKKEFTMDNIDFVDWNVNENSYRDMFLMTKCSHHIISNSTFSWWGAFLANNTDGVVVAPKKWNNYWGGNLLIDKKWLTI